MRSRSATSPAVMTSARVSGSNTESELHGPLSDVDGPEHVPGASLRLPASAIGSGAFAAWTNRSQRQGRTSARRRAAVYMGRPLPIAHGDSAAVGRRPIRKAAPRRPTQQRAGAEVRQDCSYAKKQESQPRRVVVVPRGCLSSLGADDRGRGESGSRRDCDSACIPAPLRPVGARQARLDPVAQSPGFRACRDQAADRRSRLRRRHGDQKRSFRIRLPASGCWAWSALGTCAGRALHRRGSHRRGGGARRASGDFAVPWCSGADRCAAVLVA